MKNMIRISDCFMKQHIISIITPVLSFESSTRPPLRNIALTPLTRREIVRCRKNSIYGNDISQIFRILPREYCHVTSTCLHPVGVAERCGNFRHFLRLKTIFAMKSLMLNGCLCRKDAEIISPSNLCTEICCHLRRRFENDFE